MDFSQAGRAERTGRIFRILEGEYPEIRPHLDFRNAFELLVATILAAQCTDESVDPACDSDTPLPVRVGESHVLEDPDQAIAALHGRVDPDIG